MLLPRRHRRPLAWLALLVFVLVALTPTLARALAFVQGQTAPWATLCVSGDRSGSGSPSDTLQHLTAVCPACHLQADQLLPPPPAGAGLQAAPTASMAPDRAAAWWPAGPAWAWAQPRAPPRRA